MYTCIWMAQKVQRETGGGWRLSTVWKTFNEQNGGQHRACEADGARRSSTHGADDCWGTFHQQGHCLEHHHWKSRTLSGASSLKISKCARCAQRWSPSCCVRTRNSKESLSVKTLSSASRMIQTCSGESLLAMNRGFLNTIPGPNGRVVSGKVRHHQDQRKQGCRSRRSRWCSSYFFYIKGIVHFWVSTTESNSESTHVQGDPPAPHEISPGQAVVSVGEQRMGAPPWQRPFSQCPEHPTVFGGDERVKSGATLVFARLGPLWFFSYSPSLRGWSRGPDFLVWRPSKGPWRWSSGGFQKKPSGGASKCGRRGWTSVWEWRETILKGTSCDFNIFFGI